MRDKHAVSFGATPPHQPGDGPSRALCGVHLKQAKWTKVAKPTSRCEKVLCTKNRAHDRHTLSRNSESRMVWRVADSQSWFCSVARVAGTNSGTQLAHYFVRGHGFAVELEWSPSVPRSAFLITYVVKLPRSRLLARNNFRLARHTSRRLHSQGWGMLHQIAAIAQRESAVASAAG